MKTAIEIADEVRNGRTSAVEVVTEFIKACENAENLNALTYLAKEEALAQALQIDKKRERGEALGLLAGVPVAIKDAICTQGIPTTSGSAILQAETKDGSCEPYRPPYNATVIERLIAADAIIIAKANMDEFAMGSSNETSAYGPVKNPVALNRSPGGSSGGSAAAVSAGLAPVALGSDTGGSIRQPAAFCGVVGVKPTYGRVSRYGLIAFASSLDQIGPFTRDIASSARVLEVISGADERDSTCGTAPVENFEAACDQDLKGMTFGIPTEYFAEGIDSDVRATIEATIKKVEAAGGIIKSVSMPHTHYGVGTYYILATAEASTNLSRFDGIRYGLRREEAGSNINDIYEQTRDAGFGQEVKRRILLGTYVLSAGYYDAYYSKAQKVRTLIKRDFDEVFKGVDALLTPTSPTPAFELGAKTEDPLAMYMADVYTLPASLAGMPALSLSVGQVEREGQQLPVGLQVISQFLDENTMFRAASAIEKLV